MAGDWLKFELETPDKPEVMAIASALEAPRIQVLGALILVWRWFNRHTVDGNACVTLAALSEIASLPGFAEAMAAEGWLTTSKKDGKTIISIPHFEAHNGESAKKRALNAKRQSRFRRDGSNASRNATVTHAASPRSSTRGITPYPLVSSSQEGKTDDMANRWWLNHDTILAEAKALNISTLGESAESLKAQIRAKHAAMPRTHARGPNPPKQQQPQPPALDPDQGHVLKPRGKFDDEPEDATGTAG